jgi:hypothetical protein
MGSLGVRFGQSKIAPDHLQRRMTQQTLQGKHIPTVTEILNSKRMAEPMGMDVLNHSPLVQGV